MISNLYPGIGFKWKGNWFTFCTLVEPSSVIAVGEGVGLGVTIEVENGVEFEVRIGVVRKAGAEGGVVVIKLVSMK